MHIDVYVTPEMSDEEMGACLRSAMEVASDDKVGGCPIIMVYQGTKALNTQIKALNTQIGDHSDISMPLSPSDWHSCPEDHIFAIEMTRFLTAGSNFCGMGTLKEDPRPEWQKINEQKRRKTWNSKGR